MNDEVEKVFKNTQSVLCGFSIGVFSCMPMTINNDDEMIDSSGRQWSLGGGEEGNRKDIGNVYVTHIRFAWNSDYEVCEVWYGNYFFPLHR